MNHDNTTTDDIKPRGMSYDQYVREMRRRRVARKQAIIRNAARDGIAAKARLITMGRGKNGRSMSAALLERHIAAR